MDEQETKPKDELTEPTQDTVQSEPSAATGDYMKDPNILAYIALQVQEGIQKALQGNTPKANTVDFSEQEKAKFEKMTYKERLNLFNSNPHVYNKLSKGSV